MTDQNGLSNVPTIAAFSALVAVGVSSAYFQKEITAIYKEQEIIKEHLSTIIPHIDPNYHGNVQKMTRAIKDIDARLNQTQSELRVLAPPNNREIIYKRVTKKGDDSLHRLPSFTEHSIKDEEDDIEDEDIAALAD